MSVDAPRLLTEEDFRNNVPVHVVWEITLACNLRCQHCGSRAGKRRPGELSTEQCLEVVDHLAGLGTREISLIGGEAFLREDWIEIIKRCRHHGIYVAIQTGGWAFNDKRLDKAIEAGIQGIGISIDGLEELHDRVRGVKGSFKAAVNLLERSAAAGLTRTVNTQIGPETISQLRELMEIIIETGAMQWQIQLTVAMGNAVDNNKLLLQPFQLLELFPLLAELADEAAERGLILVPGNNIGYFGPFEKKLRDYIGEETHWSGCAAGQNALALEADGSVKGCPSLPTNGFTGGNVKEMTIDKIWNNSPQIHFGRMRSTESLWGFCKSCYYADVCRGGCTWTSHSLLGRPGNNPYCHYRANELQKNGLRERIRKVQEAGKGSFDIGRFELITERIPESGGDEPGEIISSSEAEALELLKRPISGMETPYDHGDGRIPPGMQSCKSCDQFCYEDEKDCPHCGTNLKKAEKEMKAKEKAENAAMKKLSKLLSDFGEL